VIGPLGSAGRFRLLSGREPARSILDKLVADPVPYVVVHRPSDRGGRWYVFETDDSLFAKLFRDGSVAHCLELDLSQRNAMVRLESLGWTARGTPFATAPVRVVLDSAGAVRSLVGRRALVEDSAVLYPTIEANARSVEPGQVVELALQLSSHAPAGASAALDLQFRDGEDRIPIHVSVSSSSYEPAPGSSWSTEMLVSRDLAITPGTWNFQVVARGDRERYGLLVTFFARGQPIGCLAHTLPRSGADDSPAAVSTTGPLAPFPDPSTEPGLTLTISEKGGNLRAITAQRGGVQIADEPWTISADGGYYLDLERAGRLADIEDIGVGLWADLPGKIRDALRDDPAPDKPILIVADAPYAPFELASIPIENGVLLGTQRPVLRWIDGIALPSQPAQSAVALDELLCIRPEYGGSDALASAAEEEKYLAERHPAVRAAKDEDALRPYLDNPAIHAIHFAGHAQTNPPLLKLAGGAIRPAFFRPTSPLMSKGQPFLFLNGCHAGTGRVASPTGQGNMVKAFLVNQSRGVVAPAIEVNSQGALAVARMFYERIEAGDSVAAAMLAVRRAATTAAPQLAGTFLSYLAYASPALKLTWPARRPGGAP